MPHVNVSREVLEAELSRYLASGSHERPDEHAGAQRHRVLPLFSDFMGCWALDLAGQLVFFSWDAPHELKPVSDNPVEMAGTHAHLVMEVRDI